MTLRSTINGEVVPTKLPFGSATLPDGSSLWVRGSTKTVDGSVFAPREYVLQLNLRELQQVSPAGAGIVPPVDVGFPIQSHIAELSSPEQRRQFHMIEGAFYSNVDSARALEHYAALTSLPGAPWSDWLPLATMYNKVGRHREASSVFQTILPDLIRSLDMPLGENLRKTGYLRRAAMSFAVEGDTATAAHLLRLEGRTLPDRIPAEIERLQKSATKADAK
jgi:hypothetical protein